MKSGDTVRRTTNASSRRRIVAFVAAAIGAALVIVLRVVVAVAGGTVVSALDMLDDQVPGHLPDPSTIRLENVLGNHVTVSHSDGRYATYAHTQKGSVSGGVGDSVLPGQRLGKIGKQD
jgi:murein DD-endopeptidase MepM/ murein hydrolase activator NlpD